MTPRYVLWLVEHLPEDSATKSELRGGPHLRSWTTDVRLLADITNLLFVANRQRAGKATRNLPIKPPKPARKKPVRVANVAAMAARYRQTNT